MSNDFEGRLAVVTGASSGIGLAVTARLLAQGARVLAMSRKMGGLEELARHFAGQLTWVSGDVTKAEDLEQLAQHASRQGPVHYLVPNAGIAELADCLDLQAFDRQWAVNGAGALNTLSHLRGHLASPASVVFITTFLTGITFPGLAAYIASKAALQAHARTLAVELAPQGIRINMVSLALPRRRSGQHWAWLTKTWPTSPPRSTSACWVANSWKRGPWPMSSCSN